jgi:hypothetical protein
MPTPIGFIRPSVFVCALAASVASLDATQVAFDDFSDYVAGSNINGQSGGSGWSGSWSVLPIGSSLIGTATVSDHAITYSYGGTTLGGGNSLLLDVSSNGTQRNVFASSDTSGQDYYVSFIFEYTGTVFLGMQAKDSNPDIEMDNIGVLTSTGKVGARVNNSTDYTSVSVTEEGQTYFMVIEYTDWDETKGSYLTTNLWLNPSSSDDESSAATATESSTLGASGFLGVYARTILGTNEGLYIDDLKVGTKWNDVVSIPELNTSGLLVTAFSFLAVIMRRRR